MIELPSATDPDVAVVVVMTANAARARRCLEHVAAHAPAATETIVVANGAREDVAALLRDEVTGGVLLTSDVDLGIPGAWRAAFVHVRAPRIMLIHEDTELQPGAIDALRAVLDADPHLGAVAPRIVFGDGRVQSAGRIIFNDGYDLPVTDADPDGEPFFVDRPSSAAVLFDRGAYEATQGFDLRFFPATCVDADIGMSIWGAGFGVVCAPRATIVHHSEAMVQTDAGPMRGYVFRHFLQQRAYPRMASKWAVQLRDHVTQDEGLDAGLARAARRGAALSTARPPAAPREPATATVVEQAEQDAAAAARAALKEEFLAWLVARSELLQRELDWREQTLAPIRTELEAVRGYYAELEAQRLEQGRQYDELQRIYTETHAWAQRAQATADEARTRLHEHGLPDVTPPELRA